MRGVPTVDVSEAAAPVPVRCPSVAIAMLGRLLRLAKLAFQATEATP
jgi:hypothetical protein